MNNEPVAYVDPKELQDDFTSTTVTRKKFFVDDVPLYTHPVKELTDKDTKQKLIRIMGTFDLATGHADTFDELLDSLEVELRDVLGYYREALRKAQEK